MGEYMGGFNSRDRASPSFLIQGFLKGQRIDEDKRSRIHYETGKVTPFLVSSLGQFTVWVICVWHRQPWK